LNTEEVVKTRYQVAGTWYQICSKVVEKKWRVRRSRTAILTYPQAC